MTPLATHLACAALVGADLTTRAARIRLLTSCLGGKVALGDAYRLNLLGDAAAEMTPFRLAGEPARVCAMLQSRVPANTAMLAVGAELVLSYAMVALLGVSTSWATLPTWFSSIGPAFRRAHVPLWALAALALATALSIWLMWRRRPTAGLRLAGMRSSLRALAGIGPRQLAGVLSLSLASIAARIGILWVLVSAFPGAPPVETVLVGSFVLLFGQAFAPTPSGLGVVELGMLGGAAGPLGGNALSVLIYWRAYTAILPILLALVFAVPRFGVRPVLDMVRSRRPLRASALEVVEPAPSSVLAASE